MDNKTIDTYNKMAKEYDLETSDFWERFPQKIINEFVTRVAGGKVLDVGSGPGRDGLILKNKGCKIICIDASESMVKMCKEKGLEAMTADFMNLPFKDGEFDAVWAYTSLLHVPKKDISKALNEIRRVLKKSGIFGLGLIEGGEELYKSSTGVSQPRYFAYYSDIETRGLLKDSGFDVEFFESFTPGPRNFLNYISKKN